MPCPGTGCGWGVRLTVPERERFDGSTGECENGWAMERVGGRAGLATFIWLAVPLRWIIPPRHRRTKANTIEEGEPGPTSLRRATRHCHVRHGLEAAKRTGREPSTWRERVTQCNRPPAVEKIVEMVFLVPACAR